MYLKSDQLQVTDKLKINTRYAEHQAQFETLPVHRTETGIVAAAFIVTDEDIEKIKKHKRIYYLQEVGIYRNISIKASRANLEDLLKQVEGDIIPLELTTKAQLQPINMAVTPEDIEEQVRWTHESKLPNRGNNDVQ